MSILQGDLSVLGLSVLLPNLMEARKNGALSVTVDGEERAFFLNPPCIHVLGVGHSPAAPLDLLLARADLLADGVRQKALSERRRSGMPLHIVLLRMKAIQEADIVQTLREYAQEELFEVLASPRGTFRFVEGPPPNGSADPDHLAVKVPIELSYVLLEAARRADEWDQIHKAIPSGDLNFRLTPLGADLLAQSGQDKSLTAILTRVEQGETVHEIVDRTGFRPFLVWSAMFTLLNQGLIEPQTMKLEPIDVGEEDPYATAPRVPTARTPRAAHETRSGKKIVVIGDAQVQSRKIVKFLLELEGFQVLEATTGEAVLDVLDKIQVHAVLLEMVLPGADGPDLCQKIKSRGSCRDVPVIFASATSRRADVVRAMQAGASDYIVKPIGKDVLIEKIRKSFVRR